MKEVLCQIHGSRKASFVCAHAADTLVDNKSRGFYWTDVEADEPCGWCAECNERYVAAGEEWTEEAEAKADIKLLCIDCFQSLIRLNGFN